jgi:SAM-dependent methyltransferase
MPFDDATFGHLLCYDTLHHMRDYDQVFREFHRVLKTGGRAIFVEPGAGHSTSPGTLAFLKTMAHDPTWIERDVVLEEINACATAAGLAPLGILPSQHPVAPLVLSLRDWLQFRRGNIRIRHRFSKMLASINYDHRVVFYVDKYQ